MKDFATAFALALVIEGVLYSLFPFAMRRMVTQVALLPLPVLRLTGLGAAIIGVAAIWLIRG